MPQLQVFVIYHMGKGGELLPSWYKILLWMVSSWDGGLSLPTCLPTILHQIPLEISEGPEFQLEHVCPEWSLHFSFHCRLLCDPLFQYIIDNCTELELMGDREAESVVFEVRGG
ncbi:uncharacterized protein LOC144303892 [Canis aureus]